MVKIEVSVQIDAPPAYVYGLQADPRAWLSWAPNMEQIEPVGEPGFEIGSQWSIKPHGMKGSVWTVTETYAPREFAWVAKIQPGLTIESRHETQTDGRGSIVHITSVLTGFMTVLFAGAVKKKMRETMQKEAAALKRYAEATAAVRA